MKKTMDRWSDRADSAVAILIRYSYGGREAMAEMGRGARFLRLRSPALGVIRYDYAGRVYAARM